ncbi:MAG: SHOCT domain-containing protein [SAR324 cluster bacterium]|nr:SHOCT domain-containing protein [SAR324 cluster bacterium]
MWANTFDWWHMGWGFHGLGMLLFGGLLIAFLIWAFRSVGARANTPIMTPRDLLERRYAGGEITREEFEAIRKELQS